MGIYALAVIMVTLSAVAPVAAELTSKKRRARFLSPELQKNYFKLEVQTVQFLDRQQSNVNGLVESFRGTSIYAYDIFTRAFCYGKGGVLDGQAFTYDNAVAIIAYLVAGQEKKASDMLRVFRKEFYNVKNDMVGLYNSYRTDRTDNGMLVLGIDGDRIHLGPTMWIALAALQYTAATGDLQYLSFAIDMAKWAQRLNHFRFEDQSRGAASMGSGWGPDWTQIYSTENNVDYYAVLTMLNTIYEQGDEKVKNIYLRKRFGPQDIRQERMGVARWMKEVAFNHEEGYFNCGYNENGPDKTRALDNIAWTLSAFGPEKIAEMGIDPFELIDFAEKHYLVSDVIAGERIEGFDFTDTVGRKKSVRMVWMEGTGLQAVTYQVMAEYAASIGRDDKYAEYIEKSIKFSDELEKVSRLTRLLDHALPYTSKCPAEKEVILTFAYEWEVPRGHNGQWVSSVSSTIWRYFVLAGINPMVFDTDALRYKMLQ